MTDNKPLLPCPFCGGEASTWLTEAYSCDSADYVLGCANCNIYTPFGSVFGNGVPTANDMSLWNTRADLAEKERTE